MGHVHCGVLRRQGHLAELRPPPARPFFAGLDARRGRTTGEWIVNDDKEVVKGANTETDPDGWMRTVSGQHIDLRELDPGLICIEDIANALAMQCRYNGHVTGFASVAQHCVFVTRALGIWGHDPRIQLLGLLHDAAEAYVGDEIRGKKRLCPEAIRLEALSMAAVYEALGVEPPSTEEAAIVKEADDAALAIESAAVRPCSPPYTNARKVNGLLFDSWDNHQAEAAFLHQWELLRASK